MTDNFKALRDALAAYDPGPLHITGSGDKHWEREVRSHVGASAWCGFFPDSDARSFAKLIVAAVNAAPTLLAEVDRQAAEIERLRAALTQIASIEDQMQGGDWEEIEEAREIAEAALKEQP